MSDFNTDWAEITFTPSGVPEVSAEWVHDHQDEGFTLLDVREADELTGPLSCIDGHTHVPMGQVTSKAADWDRDEAIVVYCRSGGRSAHITEALGRMGFTRVASMAGGMIRWNNLSYPTKGC